MRTIANYPHLHQGEGVPGRCRHVVWRPGAEACYRPATHAIAGVGLCRVHVGHFHFWQRGGRVGTAAEMYDYLTRSRTPEPFIDGRSGRVTGEAVRVPPGRVLTVRRGARVGYLGLARHQGAGGEWHYRVEYPLDGRARRVYRRVAAGAVLLLDVVAGDSGAGSGAGEEAGDVE